MALYHADIRLPERFVRPTKRVDLVWTRHADSARLNDRYGEIPRFSTLPLASFEVIEVETERDRVVKLVMRGHWTKTLDVVFVLIPGSRWVVKTVWINERNDTHGTLDRSRYVC
jgi:hypothetical protein